YTIDVPAAGVVVDAAGNLFFSDAGNLRVRKVDTNGIITTVAGNGTYGGPYWTSPDGVHQGYYGVGPANSGIWATNVSFGGPSGLALDAVGNLFVADSANGRVQWVDTNGVMLTAGFAGGYTSEIALDDLDNVFAGYDGAGFVEVFTNGLSTL